MGLLIDGVWHDKPLETSAAGRFERARSQFRNWITPDGAPGPGGEGGFPAEAGRYHLYVSLACPWAHRTLVMRELKRLGALISVSIVHWLNGENGWTFEDGPGATGDTLYGRAYLHQIYTLADPVYSGRATVPVLWDKQRRTIVNNESAEVIRMLNSAFDGLGAAPSDYYPEPLRAEIDAINDRVYRTVNNGVYRAGFATSQHAYDEAVAPLFETLDWLDERLGSRRFLCGAQATEADIRLFTTLIRFDAVYHGHFKCNLRRIVDYPNLWPYLRDFYQLPGVAGTVDMLHIKRGYYEGQRNINPTGIVPAGPLLDLEQPAGREGLG